MNLSKSILLTSALLGIAGIAGAQAPVPTPAPTPAPIPVPAPVIPVPAPASNISIFSVTGTFQDGSTFGGSFDVLNGVIADGALNIAGFKNPFTLENSGDYFNGIWENVEFQSGKTNVYLDLVDPNGGTTLMGYTGGSLCSTSTNCQGIMSNIQKGQNPQINLTAGTVTASPEPGSIVLLGAGLSVAGLAFRKRFAK